MAVVNVKVKFNCSVETVWNIVTSLTDYAWRSDLGRIEVISENKFIEYTTDGYATTFTVTLVEPHKRWEFDMENDNIKGHWTGGFFERNGETEISFTEDVKPKKFFMKPFVKGYLKKQQEAYIADLKKVIEERNKG
ncbi:MAG: SRPBCC family protein [Lachnospiraceae bacterium]|nr:SRPBCC family protein [Lachnospiraceae bacterium]